MIEGFIGFDDVICLIEGFMEGEIYLAQVCLCSDPLNEITIYLWVRGDSSEDYALDSHLYAWVYLCNEESNFIVGVHKSIVVVPYHHDCGNIDAFKGSTDNSGGRSQASDFQSRYQLDPVSPSLLYVDRVSRRSGYNLNYWHDYKY